LNKPVGVQRVITDIKVRSVEPSYTNEVCRTPLKFGAVIVDELPFCRVRAVVENGRGEVAEGWGGIFLMDLWAWPTPELSHAAKSAAMVEINRRYCKLVEGYGEAAHPIDLFMALEDDLARLNSEVCAEHGLAPEQPFLGALVCASPVDAALHDAFGNVNGIDVYEGYGPEFMAHDLSRHLGPEFAGCYPAQYIRPSFLPEIPIFHLVGGVDKLTRDEVTDTDPQDGLPNSLDDWVTRDGMFCLKVKLRGTDLEWDIDRTLAVHAIGKERLIDRGEERLYLSADTNEQCESPEYIVEYLSRIREANPDCVDDILYIEQPTERDLTAHRHNMRPIAALKPVIIDESLVSLETFELATELGWSGIALKSCKSQSASLVLASKARHMGIPYTVQDLTNPSLALIHSVGLGARLYTMMGVEANSRQFFPNSTTPGEKHVHENIFTVRDGVATTASLQGNGLGYQMDRIREIDG
jgi:L-alanine-DL-glutamate epimerase-like enolase superfamily enzyme